MSEIIVGNTIAMHVTFDNRRGRIVIIDFYETSPKVVTFRKQVCDSKKGQRGCT